MGSTNSKNIPNDTSEQTLHELVIVNDSAQPVTIYLYGFWQRRISKQKKMLRPGENHYFNEKKLFRYDIFGKKRLCETKSWRYNVHITVKGEILKIKGKQNTEKSDEILKIKEDYMFNNKEERRLIVGLCKFKRSVDPELSSRDPLGYYAILGLDIKEVRKLSKEEQTKKIRKAYKKKIRKYHPDRNPASGNILITREIIDAYSILKDPKKRAKYHSLVDSVGWKGILKNIQLYTIAKRVLIPLLLLGGSIATCFLFPVLLPVVAVIGMVALFWCHREKIKAIVNNKKRSCITACSCLFSITGSLCFAFPFGGLIGTAVIGFALLTSGFLGLSKSLQEDCSLGSWVKTTFFGALAGAATGVISPFISGILGSVVTGCSSGVFNSLASAAAKYCSGEGEVTTKEVLIDLAVGVFVGALAGYVGGSISGSLSATFVEEQLAITNLKKIGFTTGKEALRNLGQSFIWKLATMFKEIAQERIGCVPGREKRGILYHLLSFVKSLTTEVYLLTMNACLVAKASQMKLENATVDEAGDNLEERFVAAKNPNYQPDIPEKQT